MNKRSFGRTDMLVMPIGFGGAELGFQEHGGSGAITTLLNQALDAGLNVIDTANAYLESEALIGSAVAHRRRDYFLFTKCGATEGFKRADWSQAGIAAQLDASLKALRTDYVDLLQLHSCAAEVLKQGDAIAALQRARQAGKVRYIGYSGDGMDAHCALSLNVFDSLQTSISIADQEALSLSLPIAEQQGIGVIAKRPVANAAWRTGARPSDPYHHAYYERLLKLDYAFLKQPMEQAFLTALAFTLNQPGVSVAIVGTTKPGRFEANLKALTDYRIEPTVIAEIRARWQQVAEPTWTGQV
jgi:hypothetical protein